MNLAGVFRNREEEEENGEEAEWTSSIGSVMKEDSNLWCNASSKRRPLYYTLTRHAKGLFVAAISIMPANTQTQIEIKQCNCFIIITKYWFGEGEEDEFSSKQASQSVSQSVIHSFIQLVENIKKVNNSHTVNE